VDTPGITGRLVDLAEGESLLPDLNRAARGTVACIVPLLLAMTGHLPVEAAYAVLAALSIATVDVRGGYALRFTLLLAMTAILATSAGLRLEAAPPVEDGAYLEEFSARGSEALEALAVAAETGQLNREQLDALRHGLDRMRPHLSPAAGGVPGDRLSWLVGQLGMASTELAAMLIA
jgi:hypothetical protein